MLGFPPGFAFWLFAHPLIKLWRRLGPALSYPILLAASVAVAIPIFLLRAPLLAIEFGTIYALWPAVVLLYGTAVYIERRCRKHLSLAIFVGWPELRQHGGKGKLLTEGIYARVRHPRYVGAILGMFAMALFTNYLAVYVLCGLTLPIVYLVVVLEERELRERFGDEHARYCDQVPRLIPRLWEPQRARDA